jgi:hypothetical protein
MYLHLGVADADRLLRHCAGRSGEVAAKVVRLLDNAN